MSKKYILAADPGLHGAIVLVPLDTRDKCVLIPTKKTKDGKMDVMHSYNSIRPYTDRIVAYVKEDVHAIFGMSAKSCFEFGKADGYLETMLMMVFKERNVLHAAVAPKVWQHVAWAGVEKIMKPVKKSKEVVVNSVASLIISERDKTTKKARVVVDTKATSSAAAAIIFPDETFIPKKCRVQHDGCVDAALIGHYMRIKYARILAS